MLGCSASGGAVLRQRIVPSRVTGGPGCPSARSLGHATRKCSMHSCTGYCPLGLHWPSAAGSSSAVSSVCSAAYLGERRAAPREELVVLGGVVLAAVVRGHRRRLEVVLKALGSASCTGSSCSPPSRGRQLDGGGGVGWWVWWVANRTPLPASPLAPPRISPSAPPTLATAASTHLDDVAAARRRLLEVARLLRPNRRLDVGLV
jgi:hypothetical protein